MDHPELEVYTGNSRNCYNCERNFEDGEVITVDVREGLTFCYSDAMGGCMIAYTFSSQKMMQGIPMRFGGSPLSVPENITPNYPNTPINPRLEQRFRWLRKLLSREQKEESTEDKESERREGEYQVKRLRILPRNPTDIKPHPRVKVLGEDSAGFTIVEAQLKPGEGVCWRCGSIADDPDHNLQICPICDGDFND